MEGFKGALNRIIRSSEEVGVAHPETGEVHHIDAGTPVAVEDSLFGAHSDNAELQALQGKDIIAKVTDVTGDGKTMTLMLTDRAAADAHGSVHVFDVVPEHVRLAPPESINDSPDPLIQYEDLKDRVDPD